MSEDPRGEVSRITIGEAIADQVWPDRTGRKLAEKICAALDIAPDTLVCNLHALAEGEYVVEAKRPEPGATYCGAEGGLYDATLSPRICWVVVREAVVPATPEDARP